MCPQEKTTCCRLLLPSTRRLFMILGRVWKREKEAGDLKDKTPAFIPYSLSDLSPLLPSFYWRWRGNRNKDENACLSFRSFVSFGIGGPVPWIRFQETQDKRSTAGPTFMNEDSDQLSLSLSLGSCSQSSTVMKRPACGSCLSFLSSSLSP